LTVLLNVLLVPVHVLVDDNKVPTDPDEFCMTKAVVATLVELSPRVCVVAVIVAPVKSCVPFHKLLEENKLLMPEVSRVLTKAVVATFVELFPTA
jgi:hypothetical protein